MKINSPWALMIFIIVSRAAAEPGADARAKALALAQPRVVSQYAALKAEAARITDPVRRGELEAFLVRPDFLVLARRKKDEAAIVAALKAGGLLDASVTSFFPETPAMDFVAAPGSVWRGHHSYPGGLVDHELYNLRAGLALAAAYRLTYGLKIDDDAIRIAALMHDMGKTETLRWNADGSLPDAETKVAGTPLHHILGVAEALERGWPPALVVTVASAHNPPHPGAELDALLGYLKAAAVIAGVPNAAAGLSADGKSLAATAPLEAFITHLDDHDWVLTETSIRAADAALSASGVKDNWKRDEILAASADLPLYGR
jgi:putative nucleotidyltransferase with HDIG domain